MPPTVKAPKVKIPNIAGLNKPVINAATRLTPPAYVLGLDMSLEHTGWALYNVATMEIKTGLLEPNPSASKKVAQIKGMSRLVWLRDRVSHLAHFGCVENPLLTPGAGTFENPVKIISCLVVIEGYAFGAKGSSGISLGELGGVVRLKLFDCKIPYVEVPPTQVKKFVTGKGGAPKDVMLKEVLKRWNFDTNDDNVADAYSLMQIGRAITDTNIDPLLAFQKDVTADVVKTYFAEHPEAA